MVFGQKTEDNEKKKVKPFFTGLITEYEGKTRISLWATEEFKKYMEKLAKGD